MHTPVRKLHVVPTTCTVDVDALFEQYAAYVARIGLRMLGRREEIDDFVQDVFLEIHKSRDTLRETELLKGWIAGIAVNVARHRLRRRKLAARFFLDRPPPYLEVASSEASPEERLLIARVYAALDRVSVDDRLAWSLRHLAGERLDEVALLCGCSLATVKRRIASAHEALKEVIDG
jgi:RNA polymerase sigma-70 factor (ECF subfamily)